MSHSDNSSSKADPMFTTIPTSSSALEEYYRQALDHVRRELPLLADQLKRIGVASVLVEYDGCGDSGQIEKVVCRDAQNNTVMLSAETTVTDDKLADLFYDLLEARHPGWENNDGACGDFEWNIESDRLTHTHNHRFTDYDTTEHEGL